MFQLGALIAQSLVLGYLTDYFGIENPSDMDTRNAYLYAAGIPSLDMTTLIKLTKINATILSYCCIS